MQLDKAKAIVGFTTGYFIDKNWIAIALNIASGIGIILSGYFQKKIVDPISLNLIFISLGVSGSAVLQHIMDIGDKDKPTVLGIKKDEVKSEVK
jgi:hypothetical protein